MDPEGVGEDMTPRDFFGTEDYHTPEEWRRYAIVKHGCNSKAVTWLDEIIARGETSPLYGNDEIIAWTLLATHKGIAE